MRKGTNSKRMKRMCEYYSKSFVIGTAATPPLRQKRRAVAPCALPAPRPPNEPPSPLLAATAALCHVRADLERSRLTPNAKFRPNRRGCLERRSRSRHAILAKTDVATTRRFGIVVFRSPLRHNRFSPRFASEGYPSLIPHPTSPTLIPQFGRKLGVFKLWRRGAQQNKTSIAPRRSHI